MKMRICAILAAACLLAMPGCGAKEETPPPPTGGQIVRQDRDYSVSAVEEGAAAAPAGDENGDPSHLELAETPTGDVFEIREKMFVAQSNDIYLNAPDYLGKTIKYEGLFKTLYVEQEDMTVYYVIRYGPGCCGYDSECGFEVRWDQEYPADDEWVEVTGVLEEYEYNGNKYLYLNVTSMKVLEERGAEYVVQ